jgi:hypothetical protein
MFCCYVMDTWCIFLSSQFYLRMNDENVAVWYINLSVFSISVKMFRTVILSVKVFRIAAESEQSFYNGFSFLMGFFLGALPRRV